MSKNEKGNLLVDALLALLLTVFMLGLLLNAFHIWRAACEIEEKEDFYQLYEEGTGIYDD